MLKVALDLSLGSKIFPAYLEETHLKNQTHFFVFLQLWAYDISETSFTTMLAYIEITVIVARLCSELWTLWLGKS